jgi:hypothetical protein
VDNRHRTARPGQSSQETAIGLLQTAIQLARKYPRDPMATDLAIRAHRYLAAFPVHFVTDYLVHAGIDGRPEWHRVDPTEWPSWADTLATRQRDEARKHAETHSAWAQVLAAAMEAAPEEFGTDRQGTNLERVLRVIRERQPLTIGFSTLDLLDSPIAAAQDEGPDSDALVAGEPAEAIEAIQAIAELLGVPCTQDEIEEAIRELQEVANGESSEIAVMRNTEALRTVWLIVREAGGPDGVVLPRRALIETDWSRAKLRRDEDLASGGIRYQAELLP